MSFIAYSRGLTQELGTLFYRFLRLSAVKPKRTSPLKA